MKSKGIILTSISAVLFGVTPILASVTYTMGSTPETLTFYRNLLAVPVLALWLGIQRVPFRISRKTFGSLSLVGIIGCGVTSLMLYSSYQYIGVGTATTLHFLYPLFVALIGRFVYKERLGWQKVLALIIAVTGMACFMERGQFHGGIGMVLAVGSGMTYAFYMVGIDRSGLKDSNPYQISFYIAVVVSVAMLLYTIPTHTIVFQLPLPVFAYTLIISLCTSFFAVALLQIGIKYLGATTAAIFCLFEPITSMAAGVICLREPISPHKLIGGLLIMTAVVIILIKIPGHNPKCGRTA